MQACAPTIASANTTGMLIINADDWGGWDKATNAALACHQAGRITSVTAMVFMKDSERAAELAGEHGLDAGLHLNLNQRFDGAVPTGATPEHHERLVRFLTRNKYSQLLYNPFLRKSFRADYEAQLEEFQRLYGKMPSHIDGHQHMHLCANMVMDGIIAKGQKVRRNFSFWPGEKSALNRAYRRWVDKRLARKYRMTDYFFSLEQCLKGQRLGRVVELAGAAKVELMTHPEKTPEFNWLMGEEHPTAVRGLRLGDYPAL
jgi:predicted glycoside hydrolase/deacetylase ChbG (UPF0249 family)